MHLTAGSKASRDDASCAALTHVGANAKGFFKLLAHDIKMAACSTTSGLNE
jgi:hypothetical protein